MPSRPHTHHTTPLKGVLGLLFVMLALAPLEAKAQQRLGVELSIGRATGLNSYSPDVVYTEETNQPDPDFFANSDSTRNLLQPYLARESNDWGTLFMLRIHFDNILIDVGSQWYSREEVTLSHQGNTLLSSRRLRPNGNVDDSGVRYTEIPERTVEVTQRNRGELWTLYLQGGRKFSLLFEPLEIYIPVVVGVVMTHVTEDAKPYTFGLRMETGLSFSYPLTETIALTFNGIFHGLATMDPLDGDDVSRRVAQKENSTEAAAFSTLLGAGVSLGVMFQLR